MGPQICSTAAAFRLKSLCETILRGFRLQAEGYGCRASRTLHAAFRLKPEATLD